ncbi:MAG: hypothetical protein HXX10_07755 [Rhodoplanes sp.]|uniref:hypothetical protein n=1 Tax=Rhodoplanes sp. TaxID=1968906 RepID=UPI0017970C2F|nr:hypothetical protein [Rhodoplanes sp.]NVO13916.1 hypothetical protein [Rhodoplanes sp.]
MAQAASLTTGVPQTYPFATADVAALLRALVTEHQGAARPAVIAAEGKGIWTQVVSSTVWSVYYYDGSIDVLIGTLNPTTHTWVPAAPMLTLPPGTMTLANGANANVALVAARTHHDIAGPTAAFSISGFAAGADGQVLTVYNPTAYAMTLTNDATSTAANRILTLTGADVVLRTGKSFAAFRYNATAARWLLTGSN